MITELIKIIDKAIQQKLKQNPSNEFVSGMKFIDDILQDFDKPFNPVEIGFKEHIRHVNTTVKEYRLYRSFTAYYILWFYIGPKSFSLEYFDELKEDYNDIQRIIPVIKIPYHSFGVELFKNLGIIE